MASRKKGLFHHGGFMPIFSGTLTALITPFLPNGSIDFDGFEKNITDQLENSISGLVVLGTTGEAASLTSEEQEKLIAKAVSVVKKKVPLIIGTGSYSTEITIAKTKKAKDLGADCALIVTPYYVKPTQEGLFLHYKEIAKKTAFPILLYNVPGRTSVNLEPQTVSRLMEEENIVGIKEASASLSQLMEIVESAKKRKKFSILSGDDIMAYAFITHGAHGLISVLSNLLPKEVGGLVSSSLKNDIPKAQSLQYHLFPYMKHCFIETNPGPIKAMMEMAKKPSGPVRLPLAPMKKENLLALEQLMRIRQ
jgi:4-hydroxy-tetrahydrodipicolinate synthase